MYLTAAAFPDVFGQGRLPLYCYDNAGHHTRETQDIGIPKAQHVHQPARSPELNKVVEHTHSNLCRAFANFIHDRPNLHTARMIREYFVKFALAEQFGKDPVKQKDLQRLGIDIVAIKQASIFRDFQSMEKTWAQCIKLNGDRVPRPDN